MKREDAILRLAEFLIETPEGASVMDDSTAILEFVEKRLGMAPPCLPEEECQAIMDVYYAGYTLRQWEEDFVKDEKVTEMLKRRRMTKEARRKSNENS